MAAALIASMVPMAVARDVKVPIHRQNYSGTAMCLVVKDGGSILNEWIQFHTAVGATRFYIYDDSNTYNAADFAEHSWRTFDMRKQYGVTQKPIEFMGFHRMMDGHTQVLGRCIDQALIEHVRYLIEADLDEFVYPTQPQYLEPGKLQQALDAIFDLHSETRCFNIPRFQFVRGMDGTTEQNAAPLTHTFLSRLPNKENVAQRIKPKWVLDIAAVAQRRNAYGYFATVPLVHHVHDNTHCCGSGREWNSKWNHTQWTWASCTVTSCAQQMGWKDSICSGEIFAARNRSDLEAPLAGNHYVLFNRTYRRGVVQKNEEYLIAYEGSWHDDSAMIYLLPGVPPSGVHARLRKTPV